MGVAVGAAATVGPRPPVAARRLLGPLAAVLGGIAAVTAICGVGAWYNAGVAGVRLGEPFAASIPPERHRAFLAVACAHFGTYASAVLGAVGMCVWAARERRRAAGRAGA
jgi:hypothetical protein